MDQNASLIERANALLYRLSKPGRLWKIMRSPAYDLSSLIKNLGYLDKMRVLLPYQLSISVCIPLTEDGKERVDVVGTPTANISLLLYRAEFEHRLGFVGGQADVPVSVNYGNFLKALIERNTPYRPILQIGQVS
ncbi:MAG TPA: hypothetical protein VJB12_04790 [Candidatus Nanoarchaeia archaeon]|nr:hypothetical protein [Candidatus Nanoarchaeia archaeon]